MKPNQFWNKYIVPGIEITLECIGCIAIAAVIYVTLALFVLAVG